MGNVKNNPKIFDNFLLNSVIDKVEDLRELINFDFIDKKILIQMDQNLIEIQNILKSHMHSPKDLILVK